MPSNCRDPGLRVTAVVLQQTPGCTIVFVCYSFLYWFVFVNLKVYLYVCVCLCICASLVYLMNTCSASAHIIHTAIIVPGLYYMDLSCIYISLYLYLSPVSIVHWLHPAAAVVSAPHLQPEKALGLRASPSPTPCAVSLFLVCVCVFVCVCVCVPPHPCAVSLFLF